MSHEAKAESDDELQLTSDGEAGPIDELASAGPPGEWLRTVQRDTHEWRKENVPLAGKLDQAGHTAVEAGELLDLYVKAESYEGWEIDEEDAMEEAGDVIVSLLSLLSMEGWDVVECIQAARGKNAERDWDEHTGRAGD